MGVRGTVGGEGARRKGRIVVFGQMPSQGAHTQLGKCPQKSRMRRRCDVMQRQKRHKSMSTSTSITGYQHGPNLPVQGLKMGNRRRSEIQEQQMTSGRGCCHKRRDDAATQEGRLM
eukprot:1161911-Pelagomonas_calceolata.AAC.10